MCIRDRDNTFCTYFDAVKALLPPGIGVELELSLIHIYLALSTLTRFSDIFTVRRAAEDEEEIWAAVRTVADEAVNRFVAMRAAEGERLRADLLGRLESIGRGVAFVKEQSPRTVEAYRERLAAKIREVLADRQIDEARIVTEAAIFADRVAVDEETVRLESHLVQFREILGYDYPIGRKLDFLVQEINREANTDVYKRQGDVTGRCT